MNLQQLEYIVAIDKYRHFGKASEACFITQPTLSTMTNKLEQELNIQIFDRTSYPIRTTDAGIEIVEQAKFILREVSRLKEKALSLGNVVKGQLTIGVIPTVSIYLLPLFLVDFLNNHKDIQLVVKEMPTDSILKGLKDNSLDIGIISTPNEQAKEFYEDHLYDEELIVYRSAREPQIPSEFLAPKDLAALKFWLLEKGDCLRNQLMSLCQIKGKSDQLDNLHFTPSNLQTLVRFVDDVGGVTVLPSMATNILTDSQKSRMCNFKTPVPARRVSFLYYKPSYKQKLFDTLKGSILENVHKVSSLSGKTVDKDFSYV